MDAHSQAILQELVRRQKQSLLRYVGEAFPYASARGQEALETFRHIVEEDRQALGTLVTYLGRRRVPVPQTSAFPNWFTTINFVSLDYLLPLLRDAQRAEVEALERDCHELADEEAREQVQRFYERKHWHFQQLETLAAPAAAAGKSPP
jgi:hypothetical protein